MTDLRDMTQAIPKLTPTQRALLLELLEWDEYLWKPSTCAKLAHLGLAERVPGKDRANQIAWRITPWGREVLERIA